MNAFTNRIQKSTFWFFIMAFIGILIYFVFDPLYSVTYENEVKFFLSVSLFFDKIISILGLVLIFSLFFAISVFIKKSNTVIETVYFISALYIAIALISEGGSKLFFFFEYIKEGKITGLSYYLLFTAIFQLIAALLYLIKGQSFKIMFEYLKIIPLKEDKYFYTTNSKIKKDYEKKDNAENENIKSENVLADDDFDDEFEILK